MIKKFQILSNFVKKQDKMKHIVLLAIVCLSYMPNFIIFCLTYRMLEKKVYCSRLECKAKMLRFSNMLKLKYNQMFRLKCKYTVFLI